MKSSITREEFSKEVSRLSEEFAEQVGSPWKRKLMSANTCVRCWARRSANARNDSVCQAHANAAGRLSSDNIDRSGCTRYWRVAMWS